MPGRNSISEPTTASGFSAAMRSRLCWQVSSTVMLTTAGAAMAMVPWLDQGIGGIAIVIAVAVLGAGILAQTILGRVLMQPLGRLQACLGTVGQAPHYAGRLQLPSPRHREFDGIVDGFNVLFRRVFDHDRDDSGSSERRLRDFAAAATDFFWETGPDLRLTYVSERFLEITGIEPAAMLGTPLAAIDAGGDGSPSVRDHLSTETNAGHAFRGIVVACRNAAGNMIYVSLNGQPAVGDRSQFLGYRGSGAEVAALWQARQVLMANNSQAERVNRALSLYKSHGEPIASNGVAENTVADDDVVVAVRRRA